MSARTDRYGNERRGKLHYRQTHSPRLADEIDQGRERQPSTYRGVDLEARLRRIAARQAARGKTPAQAQQAQRVRLERGARTGTLTPREADQLDANTDRWVDGAEARKAKQVARDQRRAEGSRRKAANPT